MTGLAERVKAAEDWLKDHWKFVALVSGGSLLVSAGYLYYQSASSGKKPGKRRDIKTEGTPATQMEDVSSFDTTADLNQVSLEEKEAAAVTTEQSAPSTDDEKEMSEEKRDDIAIKAKTTGNKFYSARKFEKAIELYTKGINLYDIKDKKVAVFFSNRAACWLAMGDHQKVVDDCTMALGADPLFTKAINRRAVAYEKLDRNEEALNDFTLACYLDEFKNQTLVESADRVLRKLATAKSSDIVSHRQHTDLPSLSFVTAYLSSFRYTYIDKNELPEELPLGVDGDSLFLNAVSAFMNKNWEKAYELITKSLESDRGFLKYEAEALNMRGTFYFLMGRGDEARADYEESMKLNDRIPNTYIKIASISIEKNVERALPEALGLFEKAVEIDAHDPDVYYHRGQIHFLVQDYDKALKDYTKSIELDGNFVFAKIQRAVVEYRLGHFNKSIKLFEQAKKQFPNNADVLYYHGEVLLDHQDIDGALNAFEKAIKANPTLPLPYLNQAIIFSHIKGDVNRGIEFTQKAISVDSRCELAYMHLAQMYMAQGRIEDAVKTYETALALARTEMDAENALMGIEASRAQQNAMEYVAKLKQ